jgi:pyruvate/2-oxoglutarate dehydrogenase complex dihydrolipoamide acyltransferase (E2) component
VTGSAVVVPRLFESTTTGTVIGWQKRAGDRVQVGDVLVEVDLGPLLVEIEADRAGVLRLAPVGRVVPVGGRLALIVEPPRRRGRRASGPPDERTSLTP